jgi:hypothetical protein
MKSKIKYTLKHKIDPEAEKVVVTKNIKNINNIGYKAVTKINGEKYTDVTMHEDGNGLSIFTSSGDELRANYSEAVQLFCLMETFMREAGYLECKDRVIK